MRSLAVLDPVAAAALAEQLGHAGIASESRPTTEECGIVATELFVDESIYERACDVVDAWWDDEARKHRRVCPKCQSPHLEYVPHDSVAALFKCKDCGCEILAQL